MDPLSALKITNLKGCSVFCGPIKGSVLAKDLTNCSLHIASRQVYIYIYIDFSPAPLLAYACMLFPIGIMRSLLNITLHLFQNKISLFSFFPFFCCRHIYITSLISSNFFLFSSRSLCFFFTPYLFETVTYPRFNGCLLVLQNILSANHRRLQVHGLCPLHRLLSCTRQSGI